MASAGVSVGVTNSNPVRTMMPRPTVKVQKSVDGLTYTVTQADGTTVTGVPGSVIDALYVVAPAMPTPLLDRPKGASSS